MSNYPSPCDTCKRASCDGLSCNPWRIRYLYRQKQINAYARKHGIRPTPQDQKNPRINPCNHCAIREECHEICQARADYWDACLEGARRRVGV